MRYVFPRVGEWVTQRDTYSWVVVQPNVCNFIFAARETTQRVNPSIVASDRALYHTLIDSVSALDQTFHQIKDIITVVLEETAEMYDTLQRRVDFHRLRSLHGVEYTVLHDFSR